MKFLVIILLIFALIFRFTENLSIRTNLKEKLNSKHRLSHRTRFKSKHKTHTPNNEIGELKFLESKDKLGKKRRYIHDGRLCAAAFVQNGKTFTDCTTTKSPDGRLTGQEWCYADPNQGGNPRWGFCKPVLDYDKVRMKTKDLLLELMVEIRRVNYLVGTQIPIISKLLSILSKIKMKQDGVDTRVNKASKEVETLEKNYQVLMQLKEQWERIEKENEELKKQIQALKSKDISDHPKNCDGLLGYENEGPGDGLKAQYFDNEEFMGKPIEQEDRNIDFTWDLESPTKGINFENFSIKWLGWLRVPVKGTYTFFMQSDDGHELKINENVIIRHYMGGVGKQTQSWLDTAKTNYRKNMNKDELTNPISNENADEIKAESKPISLNAGQKYKIEINMYHSVHNEQDEDGRSFIKLLWGSDEIQPQIIKDDFFYTINKLPPVKTSGFDPDLFELDTLKENDNAFKDSQAYKLADIPFQYQGLPFLKTNELYSEKNIFFTTSTPLSVFIAIDAKKLNVLPTFEDTQDGLSVLKINKNITNSGKKSKIKALSSTLFKILKKKFRAGDINILLEYTSKIKTSNLLIFYSLDSSASQPLSCGGNEIMISNPNSNDYDTCSSSSKFKDDGWGCEEGFSGEMSESPDNMWASDHQGIGAWVELRLKNPYQITRIEFKNKACSCERNSKIEISFGGDSEESQEFSLKNVDSIQKLELNNPTISSIVKITIKSVFTTKNNGGAFRIYGVPCMDPNKNVENSNNGRFKKAVSFKCEDNLINKDEIEKLGLKQGDTFLIECEENCANSQVEIYGDKTYSEDSSLCKAAYHSGILGSVGGKVKVSVKKGEENYISAFKNGIKSSSKGSTILAITFEEFKNGGGNMNLFNGMQVDIYDEKTHKWLPGSLIKIERIDDKKNRVTVSKDNLGDEFNEVLTWPDAKKITFCGEKIIDSSRICDEKSKNPETLSENDIKIAFGPGPLTLSGYLLDSGEKFQKRGNFEYGWSREIVEFARTRNKHSDFLLDNLMLFPPDTKSHWCSDKDIEISCDPSDWSFEVKPGSYDVKITLGDPDNTVQYDIQVNGKSFVKNKILQKNMFFTDSIIVKSKGKITISAICEGECENSWSRLSSVQIMKISDDKEIEDGESKEKKRLGCGFAFSGCESDKNVENCVFQDTLQKGISYCGGELYLVKIPNHYQCKNQISQIKCIKRKYDSDDDCTKYCPSICRNSKCQIQAVRI